MTTPLAAFEDGALINLALAGHAECFTLLVDRHLTAIKRCIGSMVRDRIEADDLLQEVLFKIWRRLSTFRSEASFRTWMTHVAINEVLQSHRRERRVAQLLSHSGISTASLPLVNLPTGRLLALKQDKWSAAPSPDSPKSIGRC
jgi:RNA polymerase sigma factor (sigma-70 family)